VRIWLFESVISHEWPKSSTRCFIFRSRFNFFQLFAN